MLPQLKSHIRVVDIASTQGISARLVNPLRVVIEEHAGLPPRNDVPDKKPSVINVKKRIIVC